MITTGILKRSIIATSEKENGGVSEDQRVQELKKRFNNLGVSVERTKKAKVDQMDEHLTNVEKMVSFLAEDQSILKIKREVNDIQESIEGIYLDKEIFENQFQKRLAGISEDFRANLDEVRADNKALISEFSKQGTDRLFALGLSQAKSQKQFQDQLDVYCLNMEEKIEQMREQIERENQEREERSESIEIKIMAELDKLEEDIIIEHKIQEETKAKIRSLIEELDQELSKKIEHEKKEREQSNNSLLLLLEEACNRIERNFSSLL